MNKLKNFMIWMIVVLLVVGTSPVALAEENETANANSGTTVDANSNTYVDYSKLEMRIAVANGLIGYDYTIETWTPLQKAVEEGNDVLKKKLGQLKVDASVKKIDECMSELVMMDYSKLETALRSVYVLIDENPELHDVWARMDIAVAKAKTLLISGDQAGVDAIVVEINALMEELAQCVVEQEVPEVVVKEVEVEVLPKDEYCNIPMHRSWPVMFMISAALNVGLVVVLMYVLARKRNTTDNTPLVSYNIDDDMDL